MTDNPRKKRSAPISYRPPKGREAEFDALVVASGKSVNAFLNDLVFSARTRSPDRTIAALQSAEHAALADLVRELKPFADRDPALADISDAMWRRLDILRAGDLRRMGRKP